VVQQSPLFIEERKIRVALLYLPIQRTRERRLSPRFSFVLHAYISTQEDKQNGCTGISASISTQEDEQSVYETGISATIYEGLSFAVKIIVQEFPQLASQHERVHAGNKSESVGDSSLATALGGYEVAFCSILPAVK
jgi:hypothetical protein